MKKIIDSCFSLIGDGHLSSYLKPLLLVEGIKYSTFGRSNHHQHIFNLNDLITLSILENCSKNIIYMIPPSKNTIKALSLLAKRDRGIIFVSSTSVYGNGECFEDTPLSPKTENGRLLAVAENFIRENFKQYVILRPGGLIDDSRSPGKFLKNGSTIKDGLSPINFIHTNDLARYILYVIQRKIINRTFNINTQESISKKDFYHQTMLSSKLSLIIKDHFQRKVHCTELNKEDFMLDHPSIVNFIQKIEN